MNAEWKSPEIPQTEPGTSISKNSEKTEGSSLQKLGGLNSPARVKMALISVAILGLISLLFVYLNHDSSGQISRWARHGKANVISELEESLPWWSSLGKPGAAKIKKLVEKNGIKVRKLIVVGKEKNEEGTLWTYQIQIRVNQTLIQPQMEPFDTASDLKLISSQLKFNEKLPIGMVFTSQPKSSMPKDEIAIIEYKVLVSEEETLISENPFDLFLTQEEWKNGMERQSQRIALLNAQAELIKLDAKKWGEAELAKIPYPSKPNMSAEKWRGNAGTGEPTKSVARVGSGAALGGGIGALAGRTEGGLIGALAGAVAGGVYDAVSKSNDRKKFEAEEKSRVAANRREYENEVAAYNRRKKEVETATAEYYRTKLLQLVQTPISEGISEFPLR